MSKALQELIHVLEAQDSYDLCSAYLVAAIVTALLVLLVTMALRCAYHTHHVAMALWMPNSYAPELDRVDRMRARSAIRNILLSANHLHDPLTDKKRE